MGQLPCVGVIVMFQPATLRIFCTALPTEQWRPAVLESLTTNSVFMMVVMPMK